MGREDLLTAKRRAKLGSYLSSWMRVVKLVDLDTGEGAIEFR